MGAADSFTGAEGSELPLGDVRIVVV